MTEFVDVPGGRIAYEVTASGPLAVLSHGIGVRRQAYRFLAPMLAQAGYRVASADLRTRPEPGRRDRRDQPLHQDAKARPGRLAAGPPLLPVAR